MADETADEMADRIIGEIIAEERRKLNGPACEDGQHDVRQRTLYRAEGEVLDPTWGRCQTCWRTVNRENEAYVWKAYCGSGCECRECQTRWSKPTDAAPRFDMSTVSKGSLVTMDPDHHLGENGRMGGGGTRGRWRVTGFWRAYRRDDEGYSNRYEGQTIVQCGSEEALYVSLYCICGTLIRADDFRAHATVTGHVDDPR